MSATNSKYGLVIDYEDFLYVRQLIANLMNAEFGKLYHRWLEIPKDRSIPEYRDRLDKYIDCLNEMNNVAEQNGLDESVLEFLFLSDNDKISYRACRKIYDIINVPIDDDCPMDLNDLKIFLMDCYSSRRNMHWKKVGDLWNT